MATPYQTREIGAPIIDVATETYWSGAKEGVLRIRRCTSCSKPHWYPRPVCPYCTADTEWIDASGGGRIYSVSVTRRGTPVPYAIAYVELDEGVVLLTNIVDCDLDTLQIGQRVQVTFADAADGWKVPVFRPA